MADVKIILPDGSAKEYAAGTTLGEAVKKLSNSLAKKVLAANVNGELTDLREELVDGSEVAFLTFEEDGGKHTLRHTASHVMAQAVKRLWPEAKLAIGPAIDKGFYYDIDMEHTLTPEDLTKIEKEMSRIVKENLPITKSVMSRQEAIEFFKSKNEDYKVELIEDLPEDAVISCYAQGDFIDLCAGPHVASTGKVKAFKLQSIAGAYWRGDEEYAIKPMNCPGGILVYQNEMHSYRDLPLRYAELGLVHRHELSGALHGLFRVRAFTQDDAHVFMLPEQMQSELMKVIELFDRIYSQFGLKYHVELSTKPDNAMGDDAIWEAATEALRNAIEAKGIDYVINPGDGAFYGPKLDYHIEDSLGRTWQCGTIQLDMNLPERFNVEYIGEDGQKHRTIMIHRACFGSMERFIGILTEHYAGAFPTWMAPVQVKVLPISEKHVEYANQLAKQMRHDYVRVEVDDRNEKIGYKIRQAQMEKVPYMLVVGDKEMEDNSVNVRKHGGDELGTVPFDEFFNSIKIEIKERN